MPLCTPMSAAGAGSSGRVWVAGREASRAIDRAASERYGIPSILLMENASLALTERAIEMLRPVRSGRAVVVCGPGNNGGDGFALARHLANSSVSVRVVVAAQRERYRGDALTNLRIIERMGMPIADGAGDPDLLTRAAGDGALLVDALLGTGLTEAPRPPLSGLIASINALGSGPFPVLSVDVPSGLDCELGAPPRGGVAVRAEETVTFVAPKPGYLALEAERWTGEVWVAGIGAPRALLQEFGTEVGGRRAEEASPPVRRIRRDIPPGRDRSGPPSD